MLYELLAFGGVLFWIIVGVVGLIITAQIHGERVGSATLTLLFLIAALVLFTGTVNVLASLTPMDYVYIVAGYLAGAIVWSAIKWRFFYLPSVFNKYNNLRNAWLKQKGLKEMPADPALRQEFSNSSQVSYYDVNSRRMVSHNKARITSWMIFWPFSLLETFVGDFLVNLFDRIYNLVSGTYQRMSDGMASKYDELS